MGTSFYNSPYYNNIYIPPYDNLRLHNDVIIPGSTFTNTELKLPDNFTDNIGSKPSETNASAKETQKASKAEQAKAKEKPQFTDKMSMQEYREKYSFWKRAGRVLSNVGQGILNLGAKFIGIDEDGKWDWKKCLTNVAIAGAAVAVCAIPYVGPAISAGLIATGVISGGISVTKGAIKASKAKTVEEYDNAWQEIGSGAAIGVTSALGLRGLGKGARVSGVTGTKVVGSKTLPVSTEAAASGAATTGTAASGFWGKTGQFFVDCSKNAYAGTREAMTKSKGSNFWKNIKESVTPNFDKKYNEKLDNLNQNKFIDRTNRLYQELYPKITPEKSKKIADFFGNVKKSKLTKSEIKDLLKEIPNIKKEIKELPSEYRKKEYLAYLKDAKKVLKAKERSMHAKGLFPNNDNRKAIKEYYGNNTLRSYWNWGIDTFINPKRYPRLIWVGMSKPFELADKAMRNPMTTGFKIEETIWPTFETNIGVEMASMFNGDLGPLYTETKAKQMNNLA